MKIYKEGMNVQKDFGKLKVLGKWKLSENNRFSWRLNWLQVMAHGNGEFNKKCWRLSLLRPPFPPLRLTFSHNGLRPHPSS